MFKKIAIIGVGLIGGSIGLAAKKKRLAKEVIGVGRRLSSLNNAVKKKAIDKGTLNIEDGVRGADLVIVSTPVDVVRDKIKEAAKFIKPGAIIIDVNSTKETVVKFAERAVPSRAHFVGTHPMAGSENTGVLNSSGDMFKGTVCLITPTGKTDKRMLKKIEKFWQGLGAHTEFLSPKEHDRIVANISHLPHIISYSLCNAVPVGDMKAAGTGFRDTTRIAKSQPQMWAGIFLQNRSSILKSIRNFKKNLNTLESQIKKGDKRAITRNLGRAKRKREVIG